MTLMEHLHKRAKAILNSLDEVDDLAAGTFFATFKDETGRVVCVLRIEAAETRILRAQASCSRKSNAQSQLDALARAAMLMRDMQFERDRWER